MSKFDRETVIEALEKLEPLIKEVKKSISFYDLEFILKDQNMSLYNAYKRGSTINERILDHLKSLR